MMHSLTEARCPKAKDGSRTRKQSSHSYVEETLKLHSLIDFFFLTRWPLYRLYMDCMEINLYKENIIKWWQESLLGRPNKILLNIS